MTEQDSKEKYIKCSRCKCKYHNNDDSIKEQLGYNILGERHYKRTQYNKDYYYVEHKEQKLEYSKQYNQDHTEEE